MSNLPANITNMAQALAASVASTGGANGSDLYMKFTKQGEWMYGADNTETEEGSVWAVNPMGFMHGFISWGSKARGNAGTMTGERLVPATQPMPLEGELPEVNGDWTKAVAIQMRCTSGEDEGLQVLFKANSHGGRKAYAALLQAVVEQIGKGSAECVPLVDLKNDSYTHKEYGKIFTPEIEIVGWTTMGGEAAAEAAPAIEEKAEEPAAEEPAKEEAPRRRRRKAS